MDREEALLVYDAFSISDLKEQLAQRGISSAGCVEKRELIERLLADDSGQAPGGPDLAASGKAPSASSNVTDQKVTEFCSLTGADPETATHVLEAMGGDLDQAVNLFFETGGAGLRPPTSARPDDSWGSGAGSSSQGGLQPPAAPNDEVRAPMPTVRDTLIGGQAPRADAHAAYGAAAPLRGLPTPDSLTWSGAMLAQDLATMLNPGSRGGGSVPFFGRGGGAGGPGDDEQVEWMFKPPEGMSIPTSFADTRHMCKASQKWLLVNIQDNDNFRSHALNRDVWNDETIQCLIQAEFVFWQRNKTAPEGQQFMSRYHIDASQLPIICIIDPRTGLKVRDYDGNTIKPNDLATILMDFVGQQNLDSLEAPKVRSSLSRKGSAGSSSEAAQGAAEEDEDQELLKAIQMSMQQDQQGAAAEQLDASGTSVSSSASARRVVEVPDEPPESAPPSEVIKVMIRLGGGTRVQRTFWKNDKVEALYAFVEQQAPDAERRVGAPHEPGNTLAVQHYELLAGFPHKSLADSMDKTLAEAELGNQVITMRFTG